MGKKRTEIIIETERIILIKRRSDISTPRCQWCGAASVSKPPADDFNQEREWGDEPVRDNVRVQSEVCPGCGKKRFAITGD